MIMITSYPDPSDICPKVCHAVTTNTHQDYTSTLIIDNVNELAQMTRCVTELSSILKVIMQYEQSRDMKMEET